LALVVANLELLEVLQRPESFSSPLDDDLPGSAEAVKSLTYAEPR